MQLSKYPRLAKAYRVLLMLATVLVVLIAAVVVSVFTIDLGPALRERAERAGSTQIKRPMHIGKLSVKLLGGQFVINDLVIEGLRPSDRPFFEAKTLVMSMPLGALLNKEVLFDAIEMRDWKMLVETFPNGTHNVPKFTSGTPSGRRRFVTTLRHLEAHTGTFSYEDHVTPWSVVAPNLKFRLDHIFDYRGEAQFSGGTVTIQNYLPMSADLHTWFKIVGGTVHLERIDLITDGARSSVTGDVDFAHWPEQVYNVHSQVHFPRMREIFFAKEKFTLFGDGTFDGVFHLFKGGRELKGTFASPLIGVNDYRFPDLKGSLVWLPDRLVVSDASARVYGGSSQFSYSMAPFGVKGKRAVARFDATYTDVDLAHFTDFLETQGIRLTGRASGRNLLEWPLGSFSEHVGGGSIFVVPPAGVDLQPSRNMQAGRVSKDEQYGREWGPFSKRALLDRVAVGGELHYAFGPEWVDIKPSHLASAHTYVAFDGRTAYSERSQLPFHVTSSDWEESDRLLAGILTAFGSETSAVPIGGRGQFDGVMVGSFKAPHIEGHFEGDAMRAWDTVWGAGSADITIENGYLDVTGGAIRRGDGSSIDANGRFSLGYPRKDRGDEIDARINLARVDLADLRHAFGLDDYDVQGLVSGDVHLYGHYDTPFGFGRMTIDNGSAYGERFQRAEGSLRFEGNGVRLDAFSAAKSTGTVTGAAFVGWNGTYSFNADGRRIPIESVDAVSYPQMPPFSGMLEFSASGGGSFAVPRYDVTLRVTDLFVGEEGIGQVRGTLGVRGDTLSIGLEAASPRLAVSGTGSIALNPEKDAELTFRFTDTSIDPYIRSFRPALSPFTTAVASGTIRVVGELADVDHLLVDATVDTIRLSLFDYKLQNAETFHLALDQHTVRADRIRLVGQDTQLDLSGTVGLHDRRIDVRANGNANLGIIQGFFRDIRSSGQAQVTAQLQGPLDAPLFSGNAKLTDGRLRHFSLPHSLTAINGTISFDARAVRIDDVVAKLGDGNVRFAGRVSMNGYLPDEFNITATGEGMHLRYPEAVRSLVDADLALVGRYTAPRLTGTVSVRSAVWDKRIDTSGNLLQLGSSGSTVVGQPGGTTLPLTFDVRVLAPSTFRIDNNVAKITLSADLTLRGTYDRPTLIGHAEIDRGELAFEGRRYFITRGAIDFSNPSRIDPFVDVEAETRVRAPQQTYRVMLQASGRITSATNQGLHLGFNSDPPLSQVDILTLLFGDVRSVQDTELRKLRTEETTQELLRARAARLLAAPISSEVGRVVEQTFGVDTFQLTPLLVDPSANSSRITPTAQLTIGKRVSDRVYLTYSRSLSSSSRDQIILLEFDQSDRLSWVLTRNEDETYSLDVRVRRAF